MKNKNITVKELIEILKEFDPNYVVLLSSDEEGNQFSPILDFSTGKVQDYDYGIYHDFGLKGQDEVLVIYPSH